MQMHRRLPLDTLKIKDTIDFKNSGLYAYIMHNNVNGINKFQNIRDTILTYLKHKMYILNESILLDPMIPLQSCAHHDCTQCVTS